MLFTTVVFATCLVSVHCTLYVDQPIVGKYFDSILQKISKEQREAHFVAGVMNMAEMSIRIFHACQRTEERRLDVEDSGNTVYPHLCGRIGYASPVPIQRKWTIRNLHTTVGIKLSVLYLKLPFLGLECEFSSITISAFYGQTLCGFKSNIVFYSHRKIIITLKQSYELGKESGFSAMYSAFQHPPLITQPVVFWTRRGFTFQHISPYYENKHPSDKRSWHIITQPFTRIHFQFFDRVTIYDGPWSSSPKLHSKYATAFCAYVLQDGQDYKFQYDTVAHDQYSESSSIDVTSSGMMNTVAIYKVSPGALTLVVKKLNITYTGTMAHFVERCQYGGLFVYAATPGPLNSSEYKKRFDFCQTHSEKEFTFQLSGKTDTRTHYVYVIMYAAYSLGYVHGNIQERQCVNHFGRMLVNLEFGCNYFQYTIWPDHTLTVINSKSKLPIGPVTVKIQVVNLIYSAQVKGLSMTSTDQDIFQLHEYFNSENITNFTQYDFQNLQSLNIYYRPSKWFNSINIFTTEIHNKRMPYINEKRGFVHNISQVAFFLAGMSYNYALLVGSPTYYISVIAIQPMYIDLHLAYIDNQCQKVCANSLLI